MSLYYDKHVISPYDDISGWWRQQEVEVGAANPRTVPRMSAAALASLLSLSPVASPRASAAELDECTTALLTPPAPIPSVEVELDVLVLLDGVPLAEAEELLGLAARAYAPMQIDLHPAFESVALASATQRGLMQAAREHVGGAVPPAYDAVHVLSSDFFPDWGSSYCIGGIADPRTAFSTSRPLHNAPEPFLGTPFLSYVHEDAVTVAHELGHLLGARHEMSNCAEGLLGPDGQPCTAMTAGTIANLPKGLWFGAAEASTLLAFAHGYA